MLQKNFALSHSLESLTPLPFFKKIQYLTAGELSIHQFLKKEFEKNQTVSYVKDVEAF